MIKPKFCVWSFMAVEQEATQAANWETSSLSISTTSRLFFAYRKTPRLDDGSPNYIGYYCVVTDCFLKLEISYLYYPQSFTPVQSLSQYNLWNKVIEIDDSSKAKFGKFEEIFSVYCCYNTIKPIDVTESSKPNLRISMK